MKKSNILLTLAAAMLLASCGNTAPKASSSSSAPAESSSKVSSEPAPASTDSSDAPVSTESSEAPVSTDSSEAPVSTESSVATPDWDDELKDLMNEKLGMVIPYIDLGDVEFEWDTKYNCISIYSFDDMWVDNDTPTEYAQTLGSSWKCNLIDDDVMGVYLTAYYDFDDNNFVQIDFYGDESEEFCEMDIYLLPYVTDWSNGLKEAMDLNYITIPWANMARYDLYWKDYSDDEDEPTPMLFILGDVWTDSLAESYAAALSADNADWDCTVKNSTLYATLESDTKTYELLFGEYYGNSCLMLSYEEKEEEEDPASVVGNWVGNLIGYDEEEEENEDDWFNVSLTVNDDLTGTFNGEDVTWAYQDNEESMLYGCYRAIADDESWDVYFSYDEEEDMLSVTWRNMEGGDYKEGYFMRDSGTASYAGYYAGEGKIANADESDSYEFDLVCIYNEGEEGNILQIGILNEEDTEAEPIVLGGGFLDYDEKDDVWTVSDWEPVDAYNGFTVTGITELIFVDSPLGMGMMAEGTVSNASKEGEYTFSFEAIKAEFDLF